MTNSQESTVASSKDVSAGHSELPKRTWWSAFKRTVGGVSDNTLTDHAAALTYYGILSIFPGLLAAVALIGLAGDNAVNTILDNVSQLSPGAVQDILTSAVRNLEGSSSTAGVLGIISIVIAWWSASGYVAAFMRASNAIYHVGEGRPFWKTAPLRLAITLFAAVILLVAVVLVVLTGGLADQVGSSLGLGPSLVTAWDIAKWPVLVLAISLLFAVLYWASPNVRHGGFRWLTPGSVLAVVIWLVVSAGFAFYVANFGSYNKTYGTLATPIVFLIWLWLTNVAVLLGAQFNAELERGREIVAGRSDGDDEPYLEPRDTSNLDDAS